MPPKRAFVVISDDDEEDVPKKSKPKPAAEPIDAADLTDDEDNLFGDQPPPLIPLPGPPVVSLSPFPSASSSSVSVSSQIDLSVAQRPASSSSVSVSSQINLSVPQRPSPRVLPPLEETKESSRTAIDLAIVPDSVRQLFDPPFPLPPKAYLGISLVLRIEDFAAFRAAYAKDSRLTSYRGSYSSMLEMQAKLEKLKPRNWMFTPQWSAIGTSCRISKIAAYLPDVAFRDLYDIIESFTSDTNHAMMIYWYFMRYQDIIKSKRRPVEQVQVVKEHPSFADLSAYNDDLERLDNTTVLSAHTVPTELAAIFQSLDVDAQDSELWLFVSDLKVLEDEKKRTKAGRDTTRSALSLENGEAELERKIKEEPNDKKKLVIQQKHNAKMDEDLSLLRVGRVVNALDPSQIDVLLRIARFYHDRRRAPRLDDIILHDNFYEIQTNWLFRIVLGNIKRGTVVSSPSTDSPSSSASSVPMPITEENQDIPALERVDKTGELVPLPGSQQLEIAQPKAKPTTTLIAGPKAKPTTTSTAGPKAKPKAKPARPKTLPAGPKAKPATTLKTKHGERWTPERHKRYIQEYVNSSKYIGLELEEDEVRNLDADTLLSLEQQKIKQRNQTTQWYAEAQTNGFPWLRLPDLRELVASDWGDSLSRLRANVQYIHPTTMPRFLESEQERQEQRIERTEFFENIPPYRKIPLDDEQVKTSRRVVLEGNFCMC